MDLSVARAVFTSALLRSDHPAPEVRRDDAALFTKQLLKTLNICTVGDIKACKTFITRYITPSTTRTSAFTKYLLILSKASTPKDPTGSSRNGDEYEGLEALMGGGKPMQPPSAPVRRLQIVFVLHDVLSYLAVRSRTPEHSRTTFFEDATMEVLKSSAQILAQLAVCVDGNSRGRNVGLEHVREMIKVWKTLLVLSEEECEQLGAKLEEASTAKWDDLQQKLVSAEAQAALDEQRRREEQNKWVVPRQHHLPHDPMAPWHELPAANALYQKRTQGYPIRANLLPPGGYHVQGAGQQADDDLRKEVEELHSEALRCFDKYTNVDDVKDVDALGNVIWKDRPTRNYYGFTYEGLIRKAAEGDGNGY